MLLLVPNLFRKQVHVSEVPNSHQLYIYPTHYIHYICGIVLSKRVNCLCEVFAIAGEEHGSHLTRVNAIDSEIRKLLMISRAHYYGNNSVRAAPVHIGNYGLILHVVLLTVGRGKAMSPSCIPVNTPPNCRINVASFHSSIII